MARAGLGFLALFLVAACTTPTGSPQGISSLRGVQVVLTSSVESTPYTSEQLALPGVTEFLEQCKRAGPGNCDTVVTPTNNLSEFDRAVHGELYAIVYLMGVSPEKFYTVEWRIFDPNDELNFRYTAPVTIPSNWNSNEAIDFRLQWAPINQETWQLGNWAIEILINGKLETRRSFTVVDSG